MQAHQEAMLKALVAIAWADGKLQSEETEVIEALIAAFELGQADANAVREYASTPRDLESLPLTDLSRADRMTLLQHAVVLSFVDGHQDAKETAMLRDLIKRVNLSETDAAAVIEAAEVRARRLLDLL